MKKLLTSFLFSFFIFILQAQDYQITFTASGESTTVDSVIAVNLTQGTLLVLAGTDTLHLAGNADISEHHADGHIGVYPNPMGEKTRLAINHAGVSQVNVSIYDISGKLIISGDYSVEHSESHFDISGLGPGVYVVVVKGSSFQHVTKVLSTGSSKVSPSMEQVSNIHVTEKVSLHSIKSIYSMGYVDGDHLLFKGISGNYSRYISIIPTQSQSINFDFISCMDGEGNHYSVVTIGSQTWMAENLKATRYDDGSVIPEETDPEEWKKLNTPAYCWYDNDSASYHQTYGPLYNWYAVETGDLCPAGWRVPSDDEWKDMEAELGMLPDDLNDKGLRGTNHGSMLAGNAILWSAGVLTSNPEFGISGFEALPGGSRSSLGPFVNIAFGGYWWTKTEYVDNKYALYRALYFYDSKIERNEGFKENGFSVRCIKE